MTPRDAADEPLVFLIPESLPIRLRPSVEHRGQHRTVTGITVCSPRHARPLSMLRQYCGLDVLASIEAEEHRLEIDWDHRQVGQSHDFRPTLPLIIRW